VSAKQSRADRYPLSPRIRSLQAILDRIEPPPVREPLPPCGITSRRVRVADVGGKGVGTADNVAQKERARLTGLSRPMVARGFRLSASGAALGGLHYLAAKIL